eukprot:1563852-Prymnesium_polylepis.1
MEVGGEQLAIPVATQDAPQLVAAAAQSVFSAVFCWVVQKVNVAIGGERGASLGILDIFGFESFAANSFEQLCINLANEKLQGLFNDFTFRQEEALYREEGLHDLERVAFLDNADVLGALDGRGGLFAALDDEVLMGDKGSDERLLAALAERAPPHGSTRAVITTHAATKGAPAGFSVAHYAADVRYDAGSFVAKNRDRISDDLARLLGGSSSPVAAALLAPLGSRRGAKRSTVGSQFREQLGRLVERLRATTPHFVRCVKSNDAKAARTFDGRKVLEQLRCAGMLDALRIRCVGFPFRP